MAIGAADVRYLAALARLELSAEEMEHLAGEMGRVLESFTQLQEIDTTGVAPTYHVLPLQNVMREDQVAPSLPRDRALQNAPRHDGAFIVVPRVVG